MDRPTLGGETFPPDLRLRRPGDFQRVLSRGWRWRTQHLVVYLLAGPATRLGLTVSRKVGDAVTRNRVKRRLRDGFRRRLARSLADRPVDLVLQALPGAADATQATLEGEVLAALEAWKDGRSQRPPRRPGGGTTRRKNES